MTGYRLLDAVLDRSVVLGFSSVGLGIRSRLPGWPADPEPGSLAGREVAVTGATSGLGLATAQGLARLGANVNLVVRSPEKAKPVIASIQAEVPKAVVRVHRCDVGDLDDVRRFAAELDVSLDVLVHNAGAMPPERAESPQGHELSMAVHVLGPVLMTELVAPTDRVLFVTSGGMYGQRLRVDDPEYLLDSGDGPYSPTTAYARSKRAQVELLAILERRWDARVWATHPGWADTPGVAASLPGFRRLTAPVLRDPDGGADTTVWLSAVDPAPRGGGLWHDRRQRPTHLLPTTRSRPGDVSAMWRWVRQQTGLAG